MATVHTGKSKEKFLKYILVLSGERKGKRDSYNVYVGFIFYERCCLYQTSENLIILESTKFLYKKKTLLNILYVV